MEAPMPPETNPLIIQQGMMLGIDNTVVTLVSALFLHEFLRLEKRGTALLPKYVWLTGLIAVSFWAKEFAATLKMERGR
jgi:hypothetical protein